MGVLYKRIELLCNRRGITGYRLCKDIGISPNTMTELRKGRRDGVSTENAAKIASYFGVSVEWLLGKEETAAPEDSGLTNTQRDLISRIPNLTEEQAAALLAAAISFEAGRKDSDAR